METTITIERDDNEIEVTVTGRFWPGCRGVKAHPMDRFAPPDDEDEMEVLDARDSDGNEVELTAAELDAAADKLLQKRS